MFDTVVCICSVTNMFGQVQRALTLFATGTVTLDMFTSGNKNVTLPKTLNTASGKPSDTSTAFTEIVWGNITRARVSQARTVLRDASLEKIIQKAKDFEKISSNGSKASTSTEIVDVDHVDGSHTQLVDLSDPEWDYCKSEYNL
jgi:hypothetical protein